MPAFGLLSVLFGSWALVTTRVSVAGTETTRTIECWQGLFLPTPQGFPFSAFWEQPFVLSFFFFFAEGNYGLLSLQLLPIIPFQSCQIATTVSAKDPDVMVCKLLVSWQRHLYVLQALGDFSCCVGLT